MKKIVILGGGITGLFTGWLLSKSNYEVTIIEKTSKFGGTAGSFKHKDMILDYGPHKFYSNIPGIMDKMKHMLGEDCFTIKKKNSIRLKGKYFAFPPKIVEIILGLNPIVGFKCGVSFFLTTMKGIVKKKKSISYEDHLINGFGRQGYNLLFRDYAKKIWGDPKTLSEELARKRIPVPNILQLVKNIFLGDKTNPEISAEFFYYPKQGFGRISEILMKEIKENNGTLISNSSPKLINGKEIKYTENGKEKSIKADQIVSTIPLKDLIETLSSDESVKRAASSLRHRGLIIIYVVVKKNRVMRDNWIFFLEKEFIFNRVSELKSFSEFIIPKDKTVLMAEITADKNDEIWNLDEKELFRIVLRNLEKADILKGEEIEECFTKKSTGVYPIYDLDYRANLKTVLDFVHNKDILTIGRHGLFNYNNVDHCYDMAIKTSQHIKNNGTKTEWEELLRYFNSYKIVD